MPADSSEHLAGLSHGVITLFAILAESVNILSLSYLPNEEKYFGEN